MPVLVGGLFNIFCPCNPNAPAPQTLYPAVMLWRVFVADNPPTRQRVIFPLSVTLAKHTYNVRGSSINVLYSSAAICLSVSICSINSAFDKSATVRKSWEYTPVSSLTRSTYIIGENSRKRRSVCSSVRRSPASQIACLNVGTT